MSSAPNSRGKVPVEQMLEPLAQFYRAAGHALPEVAELSPDDVPQPYHGLLVHQSDMTSTLEKFFHQRVHLDVLQTREEDGVLYREVILVGDNDGHPTEFGAIRIHLDRFADEARRLILEGHLPLGRVLADEAVEYRCCPQRFFCWEGDALTSRVFSLDGPHRLYGRHNILERPNGDPLAEAVEILPRIEAVQGRTPPSVFPE